jgi:hypothetical protein
VADEDVVMIAVRRFLLLAVLGVLSLALSGVAEARIDRPAAVTPQGLTAFLLRTDEPVKHEFDRTPSFAWLPVRGALRYEFELATSKSFTESSIVWSNANDEFVAETPATATTPTTPATPATTETAAAKLAKLYANLRTPTIAIDLALPWITGSPYALYAHVRAITSKGVTSWSEPYGFNIRWSSVPKDLNSTHPGLVRWSPVEGATAYQVWIYGAESTFMTTTNVADARDLYTFHRTNPFFTGSIRFRVRAQRALYGEVVSGLPATTWGPWSPTYTDVQPPLSLGTLGGVAAVSDVQSDSSAGHAHALTPGFAFRGDSGGPLDYNGGAPAELFRVYVATDEDCVNIVFRGAVVGSPAYAPRTTGPLELPADTDAVALARGDTLKHGSEGKVLMVDGTVAVANEEVSAPAAPTTGSGAAATPVATPAAKVDLPDTAWPTGAYYWTVVPVVVEPIPTAVPPIPPAPVLIRYRETELPQDACQSGRVMRFGKATPPVVTSSSRPFASGLSPKGRLISAAHTTPSFYGTPLVAWESVLGAQEYEIQWSKGANPWRPLGSLVTAATSSLLPLEPGTWYYRVRGYNHSLLKRPQMAWSTPTPLKVSKPTFSVVKGGR